LLFIFRFVRAATGARDENLKGRALALAEKSQKERYAKVEVMNSSSVSEAG
jgi:hypothetical protein